MAAQAADGPATGALASPRPAAVRALLLSCHPLPSAAVTVFTTALAVRAGNAAGTCALVAVAVLAGQLSIGWSNDLLDAGRDRATGRPDKPVAAGLVPARLVAAAVAVALAGTGAASLALGLAAGLLHLGAVGCGWLYNAGLKSTWFSWLPYALAFGSLPAIAALARPGAPGAAWWAVTGAALLGVGAHVTNVLPDLEDDRATGVRGLPHRLGARSAVLLAAAALLAGSAVLVLGPAQPPSPLRAAGLAVAAAVTLAGVPVAVRRPAGRWGFTGTVALVALDLVLLLLGPSFVR